MPSSLIELKERLELHFYHWRFRMHLKANVRIRAEKTGPQKRKRKHERMRDLQLKHHERKNGQRQSLSIGASNTNTGTWTTKSRKKPFSDQRQSIFFSKLPAEIREKIYEFALLDTREVRWYFNERPGSWLFLESTSYFPTNDFSAEVNYNTHVQRSKTARYSFLQTCRLVYTEALPLLYRKTQFSFDGDGSFTAFTRIVSTTKIQMIRSARIDYNYRILRQWTDRTTHIESWDNLRSLYLLYFDWDETRRSHALSVINEAAKIKNCVFHVLVFSGVPGGSFRSQGTVDMALSLHLVVDPTNDPDWRIPFNNGYGPR